MIALWAPAVYLRRHARPRAYLIATVPAMFMSGVSFTYILMTKEGFSLSQTIAYPAEIIFIILCTVLFLLQQKKENH